MTWANAVGAGIANGLARVLFGLSLDFYSFRNMFGIAMSIQFVCALIAYEAVYQPWLYVTCILVSNFMGGCVQAGIPIAVVNIFGVERGVGVVSFVNFGILFVSIINVILTVYLMDILGLELLFYIVALMQGSILFIIYFYEEDLDIENLKKHDALEIVQKGSVRSDDKEIEL